MSANYEDDLTMSLMTKHFVDQVKGLTITDYNGKEVALTDYLIPYLSNISIQSRKDEAKYIFDILWDEDGSPFQRDDPPREILDRIAELEAQLKEPTNDQAK